MDDELYVEPGVITRTVLAINFNAERPARAVQLLELVRDHINTIRHPHGKPTHMVRDIVLDLYSGSATIYTVANEDPTSP